MNTTGITRQNPYLAEIIEVLDQHLARYGGDRDRARQHLSKEDNQWIDEQILKCITDTRYFISNYYAIRTEDQGFQGLYPLWDSQEILHDEFRKMEKMYGKVRALILKARQMGATTYICAEFFHKTIFVEHTNAIIVAQDQKQAAFIYGMYDSALDFLPWWMRPRIKSRTQGEMIEFDEKDEAVRAARPGLKTTVYADNANKPTGVGRGRSYRRALLDELAFWSNGSQLSKSLLRAMNASDGFYTMSSTANGRNDFWHNLWRRAEAGKIDWHPVFIPFYRREKSYSMPIAKSEVFELTPEELEMKGRIKTLDNYTIKDEVFKWMRNTKEEFIATDGDDKMFSQEYTSTAEESFQSSAVTAFPRGLINRLMKRTCNPKWIGEIAYDFKLSKPQVWLQDVKPDDHIAYPETHNRFHIWEKPVKGEIYTMGVDVSLGNEGGDYSCVCVLKHGAGHQKDEQVAVWHGLIVPENLAEVVFAIGWMYNEALAAIEVNSMGMVTNSELVRQLEYENIYRFKRLDRLKNFMTDIMGWWTDEKSKRALFSKFSKTILDDTIIVNDKFTVDELYDLTEEGAIGEGAHDDLDMALFIALYCGHEGEVSDRREGIAARTATDTSTVVFEIKDRNNLVIATTVSQHEAEKLSKKNIGSSITRSGGATASVTIAGKKAKVPSDYQNSDWSPIFDGDGTASRLYHEDGVDAELITPEMIAQAEYDAIDLEADDGEAWKYS